MVAALALMLAAPGVAADLRDPFSGDELFTYYGSMASGPAELYEFLTSGGVDSSPPLYFIAVWQAGASSAIRTWPSGCRRRSASW